MRLLFVCIPILAGCASTIPPSSEAPVLGAELLSVSELARRSGLSVSYEPERNRLLLRGGLRQVVLYPGTTVATVNGRRVSSMGRILEDGGGAYAVAAADAARIERMLRTVPIKAPVRASSLRTPRPPPASTASSPAASPDVPATWRTPLRREWRYIVIHHSGTASGSAASFHRYHTRFRGWDGLGYHFVIGNGKGARDGLVEVGYRWTRQKTGAHAGRGKNGSNLMNERGIGICLVGDFEKRAPTKAQLASLRRLIDFLAGYCGIPAENVLLHRDVRDTRCPGRRFPTREFVLPRRAVPDEVR